MHPRNFDGHAKNIATDNSFVKQLQQCIAGHKVHPRSITFKRTLFLKKKKTTASKYHSKNKIKLETNINTRDIT